MKRFSRACAVLLSTSLLALSACGDDDGSTGGGAACEEAQACGGDPTGSWTIEETCLDTAMFAELDANCGAEIDVSGVAFKGSAEFKSDGTYATTSTVTGPMKAVYPPPCLVFEDTTITCAQLDQTMQDLIAQGEAPYESATCAAAGQDCVCNLSLAERTTAGSGTWSVSGTSLITGSSGEAPQEVPFCVEGSSLTMAAQPSEAGSGAGPLTSYLRLMRR
ncbi:hypothetical protein WME99_41250 [Sorangium sp. So ce136]|uniref:hypothetical protein n=1 Tax=Sorangium sp. So ce136 TaxID=3133284 RepID=UPI003F09F212